MPSDLEVRQDADKSLLLLMGFDYESCAQRPRRAQDVASPDSTSGVHRRQGGRSVCRYDRLRSGGLQADILCGRRTRFRMCGICGFCVKESRTARA
jgi:hypothetical protein